MVGTPLRKRPQTARSRSYTDFKATRVDVRVRVKVKVGVDLGCWLGGENFDFPDGFEVIRAMTRSDDTTPASDDTTLVGAIKRPLMMTN